MFSVPRVMMKGWGSLSQVRPQPLTRTLSPGFQSGERLSTTVPARSIPATIGSRRAIRPLPLIARPSL